MSQAAWARVLDAFTLATPGHLAQQLDPRSIQTPALDLIDRALVNLANTPDGRLIVTMPPQEGKSTRVAGDFPAWALTKDMSKRIVVASYGAALATRNGRAIRRRIINLDRDDLRIADDHGSVSDWTLAGHDGGVFSVGIGGGITGRAADLLIIDDPIKSRKEAESALIRDRIWDWWTDEASARLAPGAPVVLIMTRWHQDDLAGRLLARDTEAGWQLLNIPAQADTDDDPLGRQPGEFMRSARGRTTEQWEARKRTVGSRTWHALYQGRPAPAEGGLFQRTWWRTWYDPPRLDQVFMSWDMAFKGTDTSDYVVGQVWAIDGPDLYLIDQARGRWSFTETLAQFRQLVQRWPMATAKLVEDKANGTAVIDMLSREIPGIIPVEPEGGKTARAAAVTPLVEAGNVYLPAAPWAADLIEEAASFPNSPHDDQVDALTQAITYAQISTARQGGQLHVF